ncbi:MAG: hypothetical protein HW406_1036 [Candidatus Brocadiaceae bacterium]|nr:hypothetical protein [Candidatus Brocadiaceae bacterium]
MRNRIKIYAMFPCFVLLFCSSIVSAKNTTGLENPTDASNDLGASVTKITARTGRITQTQVEMPSSNSVVHVFNNTKSSVDVDFIAINADGNEVAWETKIVNPRRKARLSLQKLFPELILSDLSSIQVQSSVRPLESDNIPAQGILAATFFSQRDQRWSSQRLGTCSVTTTIGNNGCAISCIAMAGTRCVSNCNPGTMNNYLTNNYGYASGCLVIWAKAANIDGTAGFSYLGTGSVGSAANLKSLIDNGKFAIAKSARFTSHYSIIYGYCGNGTKLSDFYYLDPWDISAVCRIVGDGWVNTSSATQIYK